MTVKSVSYSLKTLHAFQMTDDTVGAPVYATGVRLECARKLGFGRNITTGQLEGDGAVCHATRDIKSINFEIDFGGVPLDVIKLLQGSTINEIVGPPLATHLIVSTDDEEIAFGLIGKIVGRNGNDSHIALYNCREQDGGPGDAEMDAYQKTMFSGLGLSSPFDESALYGIYNEDGALTTSTTWATNVVTNLTGSY